MYDIQGQSAPIHVLNQFTETTTVHNYNTLEPPQKTYSMYWKASRTERMKNTLARICVVDLQLYLS